MGLKELRPSGNLYKARWPNLKPWFNQGLARRRDKENQRTSVVRFVRYRRHNPRAAALFRRARTGAPTGCDG